MIYRVAMVVAAESRWSIFRIDRQAPASVHREWRWMTIFVATEFFAGASHGRRSRPSRAQLRR
jgi:hypothetical protein